MGRALGRNYTLEMSRRKGVHGIQKNQSPKEMGFSEKNSIIYLKEESKE